MIQTQGSVNLPTPVLLKVLMIKILAEICFSRYSGGRVHFPVLFGESPNLFISLQSYWK